VGYHLQIFDRIGLLIFETDDYQVGWNGRFKYSIVQHGNYRWEITYGYENESEKRYCWGK
jgi:gliding motility-associated-like protein